MKLYVVWKLSRWSMLVCHNLTKRNKTVWSCKQLLHLLPIWNDSVQNNELFNSSSKFIKIKEDVLTEGVNNFLLSFNSESLKRTLEFTLVNVLLKHQDRIVENIQNIKFENREFGDSSRMFHWVDAQYHKKKRFIKSNLEKFSPHKYLSEKYTEASEILAYKDCWKMMENISEGWFIVETPINSIFERKTEIMKQLLVEIIHKENLDKSDINDDDLDSYDTCWVSWNIF